MNRAEHLQWCKNRALAYVKNGDLQQAFTSMLSDLTKHEELKGALKFAQDFGGPMFFGGMLNTSEKMIKFIEGFN